MKSIKSFCFLLFISFLATAPSPIQAAHSSTIQQGVFNEPIIAQKTINTQKKGLVKRWLEKHIIKKMQESSEGDAIKSSAKKGLIFGALSFGLLILGVSLLGASGGLGGALLLGAGISAILGDIFSIKTRRSIRNSQNPEQYRKEKNKANWGLILSLLTGLIPLGLLIYVALNI